MSDPRTAAQALVTGFVAHDNRNREQAIEAFQTVDDFQFPFLSNQATTDAANAYVDALWAKDDVEDEARRGDGVLDPAELATVSYRAVERAFERRARVTGADSQYAVHKKQAWRQHKLGGDYWTPVLHGHRAELRAILRDDDYPHKNRHGLPGFGSLPVLYLFGVELHDTVNTHGEIDEKAYSFGIDVVTAYFQRIRRLQQASGLRTDGEN